MSQASEAAAMPKTVDGVMAAAQQMAGLEDFGDLNFLDSLGRLLKAFQTEADLSELGEQLAYGGVINNLVNRLRYVRDLKAHPEILEEKIERPIVILGLPRTGTTKLQRVLSASPQALAMEYWRMMNPAPFPGEEPGKPVERIQMARDAVQMLSENFPGFMARHPTEAEVPDEEVLLMQGSFQCVVTWLFAHIPSFYEFCMNTNQRPLYDFRHVQMQYMQWQQGGAQGRSWIMKSPCHTGFIDTLLEVFPDAVFVHCHRDVNVVMPSMSGLTEEMRRIHSDQIDSSIIGPEMLDYFGTMMDRYIDLRDRLPSERFMDVHYMEIMTNLEDVIERAFALAGRKLDAETLANAQQFDEERPQHYLGSYTYAAEDYGFSQDMISARFARYAKRFAEFNK